MVRRFFTWTELVAEDLDDRTGILFPSESIILASPILDRTAFLSKKRTLILTDFPRLICIKETLTKVTLKAEVFIASTAKGPSTQTFVRADTEGDKIFTIKTVCPPSSFRRVLDTDWRPRPTVAKNV